MFTEDLSLLCCPRTKEALELSVAASRAEDGEILEGELCNISGTHRYAIRNGIPRFVQDAEYNKSWDYKWTQIDKGKGLNYKILDKNDPAYKTHDIFDRNNHEGKAYEYSRDKVVLDIGCGVGQYSYKLLSEYQPAKVVSLDLTGGVDIFRKIMLERFPHLKRKLLLVQASVFEMPFREDTFDYVFSLGVLMHTGNTREAVKQAARVLKVGGQINFWVYGAESVHIDIGEEGRSVRMTLSKFAPLYFYYFVVMFQINLFRRFPHWLVVKLIGLFSSDLWYWLCGLPYAGYVFRVLFPTVMHPDHDYRLINNYDGWCNNWADTWTEYELFPTLREANIAILGISAWQTGFWGEKRIGFYR